jgi:TonB-linked SusC/RagA family outer membrane protein
MYAALLLVIISHSQLWAQDRTVTGKVTSADDGSVLPGVNVLVKGTSSGTTTDAGGNFSISVSPDATLVFSFIGLASQEVAVGNRTSVDVKMESDVQSLSEVVVTGYGERNRSSFTGAVSTVGGEQIQNKPFATIDQALQGNVAGLQLSAASGTPGAVQDIRIRGISSITASNDPLYVIDGVPVVSGNNGQSVNTTGSSTLSVLSSINSNDIESITVLKDPSATAPYGARGANGVIIITTKRGKSGKPVVSFSAQTGVVDRAVEGPKMLNSAQWNEMYYEALVNAGEAASIEEAQELYPSGWDGVTDTDWRDVVRNKKAMTQNYDVSVRGGNDKSNYYTSLGYFQQDGVNVGSNYERITGKLNYGTALSDKISINTATSASFVKQNGQLEGSAYFGNPDATYLFTLPIDRALNADGTPNLNLSTSSFNPLYLVANNINRRNQTRLFNSTTFEYNIIDRLKFTSTIGLDYLLTEELYYNNRYHGDAIRNPDNPSENGSSYTYMNRNFNWNWKNILDYSLPINDNHKIDFKLVYEAQKNQTYNVGTGGYGFASDNLYYPSSAGTPDLATGYTEDWSINSVMGMVNYTLKGNIFVDGTFRREGNSRFAPGKRWGSFYSVGASWVFSDEQFMQGFSGWLNTSKLRASYGETGNAGIPLNQYQALLSFGGIDNSSTGSYNGNPAASPSTFGNTNLTWEKNQAWNIGLDFGVFNRITGTVEYFRRRTYDLLLDVPLSYTTGFSSQTQNVGEMVNKGWEASLNADILKESAFKWNLGINFTSVHNKITKLPISGAGEEIGITSATRDVTVGQPVYSWYLQTWAGVNPETGAPLWYRQGTSGETTSTYSQAGRSYHKSAAPTFFGGLTNRFEFKGIYLSANLYYSTGNAVYDTWGGYTMSDGRFAYNVANSYASLYNRWQQPGDIAENPKNVYGNTSLSASASTRRLYDGEFLRLRDITFGYNLPTTLLTKVGISGANIYVKGNNIWTHVTDKRLQFDPEVKADGFLDLYAPPLKTYAVGLVVNF